MDIYTIGWLLWITFFVVWEGAALVTKRVPGATLSSHVWKWFSIKNKGRAWRLRRLALLAGLAWLSLHFLTGGNF